MKKSLLGVLITLSIFAISHANAAIEITEVAPWSSGNSPIGEDWFELTNTGNTAVDISNWSWDDDSRNAGTASFLGISSIDAGQSVVFVDSNGSASSTIDFINNWFNGSAPTNFAIGYYEGPGLSTSGDEVNVYDENFTLQAQLIFGSSTSGPYQTFENIAGLSFSQIGVNGAFAAANSSLEIGSPGTIVAIPEPETYALILAGLGLLGFSSRKHNT
jgi:hypothetical protein